MFCVRCGTALPEGAAFCPACGSLVATAVSALPPAAGAPESPAPAGATAYAPPPAPGAAPFAPPLAMPRYGGFWRRFWGYVLDGIILNVVTFPLGVMFGVPWARLFLNMNEDTFPAEWVAAYLGSLMMLAFLGMLISWLYAALLQSSAKQATLGQMALGLRVTDLQGRRISFARATGRYFATLITNLTFLIGYVIAAFTAKKQALHDLIASTLVVR